MSCNYIYNSGLQFHRTYSLIFPSIQVAEITPAQWVADAKEKYGDKFVAVYRWDEPGGDQIDHSKYQEVKAPAATQKQQKAMLMC